MWRVFVPLPRSVRVMPSGPIRRGRMAALARRGADGEDAVGLGGRASSRCRSAGRGSAAGSSRRRPSARRARPSPGRRPVIARLALDHDEDDLALAGRLGGGLAGAQPVEREADVAPAGRRRGDLVHLAVGAEGLAQQRAGHAGVRAVSRPVARAIARSAFRPMFW